MWFLSIYFNSFDNCFFNTDTKDKLKTHLNRHDFGKCSDCHKYSLCDCVILTQIYCFFLVMYSLKIFSLSCLSLIVEPQKGIPQCGSPVKPAGIPREQKGMGLKILSAGRESRKESAFPQTSNIFHYLQVLTKNFDLNLTQILEMKSIEYLKISI